MFSVTTAAENFKGVNRKDLILKGQHVLFFSSCHVLQWKSNPVESYASKHVEQSNTTWRGFTQPFDSDAGTLP